MTPHESASSHATGRATGRVTGRATGRGVASALAIDAALVLLFAGTGRASHREDVLAGLWSTAWPFLTALAVGWIVTAAWRRPFAPVRTGAMVWLVTVAGGMILRALVDQGVQVSFVAVAAAVLGAFLVGWRVVATLVRRGRRPRATGRARH